MPRVLLVNGPNLNLLGTREPAIYGAETLDAIVQRATEYAQSLGIELRHVQSNHEGALIDALHEARDWRTASSSTRARTRTPASPSTTPSAPSGCPRSKST